MKDSLVPDMFDKISGSESSFLGKVASKIPGFRGYIEGSRRREADDILRRTIAARLQESRLQLGAVHQELSRDIVKAMDHAESLGRADTRLNGLLSKIKNAPEGYSGFFDAVKVENEDLEKIYALDESMLTHAEQIGATIAELETAVMDDGNISGAIRALDTACREAADTFSQRDEIITGTK